MSQHERTSTDVLGTRSAGSSPVSPIYGVPANTGVLSEISGLEGDFISVSRFREANRIILAWGPAAPKISPNDADRWDERPGCRHPRQDGTACWGDVDKYEEVCARHRRRAGAADTAAAANRACRALPETRSGVYLIVGAGAVKIGMTVDLDHRLKALQASSPTPLRVERFIKCHPSRAQLQLELYLHARYAAHRQHGEWFDAEPVLADISRWSDGELLSAAGAALPVVGSPRDLARWLGTESGRDAAEHLPLQMESR